MFLALIILGVSSTLKGFDDISYGDGFGPLEVSWPNTWVVSRFEADSNYEDTATKLYFYFSVEGITSDISNYYAGISFPDDTSFTSCTLAYLSKDDNDWTATCTYDFGDDLVYGPIDFVLSESSSGQIVARDCRAGFIAFIDGTEPTTDSTLTVTYLDEADTATHVVSAEDSLIFSFILPTDSGMYPGDYIVITPSTKFTYGTVSVVFDEKLDSSDAFATPSVYTKIDNKNTVDTADDTITSYYVYGCADEIAQGSTVTFTFKGVVNPSSVIDTGAYGWALKVWRFGTNTLIASYSGDGPTKTLNSGAVSVTDWSPTTTSVFDKTKNILQNLQAYWTLTFKVEHSVPASGIILVDYTGVTIDDHDLVSDALQVYKDMGDNPMIFVSTAVTVTEEIKTSTQAKITVGTTALPAGSVVTLINYLKVGSSATTIKADITTTTSGGKTIDKLATSQSVTVTTDGTSVLITDAKLWLVDSKTTSNEITEINKSGTYGIVATFTAPVGFVSTETLDIYLPFATGTASSQKNLVGGSNLWGKFLDDTSDPAAGYTDNFAGTAATSVTASSGKITFKFSGTTTNSKQLVLFIGSGSSSTATNFYTPFTSLLEPSEVIIKYTKSSKTYFATSILSFTSGTITPTVEFLCKNVQVDGNPVKVSYTPVAWTIPTGATLKTSFQFTDVTDPLSELNLYSSSNLVAGESYPSTNKDLKIAEDGTVYFSSSSSLTASAVSFTVPILSVTSGNEGQVDVTWTVTSTTYGKSFVIYTGTDKTTVSAAQDDGAAYGEPSAPDFTSTINTASTVSVILKAAAAADINRNDVATDASVVISSILILPAGFTTSDSKFTANAMVSSNSAFPYNVYFATNFATLVETATTAHSYSLSLTPSWEILESGDAFYTFIYGAGSDFTSARTCSTIQGNLIVNSLGLDTPVYLPTTSTTYTYNSRTAAVSLTIKTKNAIYKGSVIVITLKDWSTASSAGWSVKIGSAEVKGSASGKVWTSDPTTVEFATASTISISISDAVRPAAATLTYQGFETITVTKSSIAYISWASSTDNTKTTFTDPTVKKQTNSAATAWVYPDVAGSEQVYFGLSFTSTYLIPSGATIAIDADFSTHEDVEMDLWSTHSYSAASVSSGVLSIVLSQDLAAAEKFEIVLDLALDIPSTATSVDPILVTVTCDDTGSTVAIADTATTGAKQVYTISAAPTAKISEFDYDSLSADSGFASWYSFNLTLDTASPEEFWVDLDFDGDFDAVPGPSYQLDDYGNALLLPAMNGNGEPALCFASHWIVSCYVDEVVIANGVLTLWVMLYNGQVSGTVSAYITDMERNLIYKPFYSGDSQSVTFTNSLKNSIDLYFAISTPTDATELEADLELQAFVDIEAKAGESLWVTFPYPYDLELTQGSSVSCSLTYYNNDGTEATIETVIEESNCAVDGNMVEFTLAEDKTFTSANWTFFTIKDIETPSSGFERDPWVYEGETLDYASGSFCILYSNSDDVVSGASFDNLNAAFSEFNEIGNYVRLVVNGGKNIAVTPGTISGPFIITSEDGDISAQLINIKGSEDVDEGEEATIQLSDGGAYSIDYINVKTDIYVGAETGAAFGMYYIRWEIVETPFTDVASKYIKPRATIVEVSYENTYKLIFGTETIYVPPDLQSFPITVYIDSSDRYVIPYTEVSLKFTPDDSTVKIDVSPNPLVIDSEWPENYFDIRCTGCTEGSSYTINVTVEGTDSDAFYSDEQITFKYEPEYTETAKISVTFDEITSVGFNYNLNSDSRAIVSWALVCDEVKLEYNFTYESILEQAFLFGGDEGTTIQQYIDDINEKYSTVFEQYNNYADIAYYLFKYGSEVAVPGQSFVDIGDNVIWSFDFLVPGLNYTVYTFVDNLSGSDKAEDEQQVATLALPPHAKLSIDFGDQSVVINNIIQKIAKATKWDSTFIELSTDTNRRMATSVSGYVYSDPNYKSSAFDAVNDNKDSIEEETGGKVTVDPISSDTYEDGAFSSAEFVTDNGIVLLLNYTVDVDGSIYCLIQNGSGIIEDTDTVYSAEPSNGGEADYYAYDVIAEVSNSISWNFTELGYEVSTYSVNCIACNAYPGDPSCSDVVNTDYVYTATSDNENNSGASFLAAALAAYLLI